MPTTPSSARATSPGSTRERMRRAPVETGLGMRPAPDAARGVARIQAPIGPGVRTAGGGIAPVLPALLADSGIGYLVFSTAKLTAGAPTLDLRLDLVGAPAPEARWLTAGLTLLHLDDEIGVGRAEMRDDTGVLVAHAVVTMALSGVPARPGGLATGGGPVDPDARGTRDGDSPDAGEPDFRSALPPFDPSRLDPAALEVADVGGDVLFTPGPSTANLNGTTHGAVLSGLAAAAQASHLRRGDGAAARSAGAPHGADARSAGAPLGGPVRPLSLTVEFLRPVQVDATLQARSETVRDGRRFWSVRTELLLPDGRPAVRAVGGGLRSAGSGAPGDRVRTAG
ncbi:PaaI family thioesterase [Pseudonocardia nantongensis]|uniref:PaaI family thioesterase n=1 Tax=Pseudonocardia nantongensis TaxID=1181885 RepID=UPI00397DD474